MNRSIIALICLFALSFSATAKNETVKEVIAKKSDYLNTEFTLKGIIHEPDSLINKSSYYLVDRSDDSLELRTDEDLEIGQEYRLEGKLKEKDEALFFKVEDTECLDCEDEDDESSTMLFVLSALVVVLGVVIVFIINRQKTNNAPAANPFPQSPPPPQGGFTPNAGGFQQVPPSNMGQSAPNPAQNQNMGGTDNYATIAFNPSQLPKEPITESKTVVMSQPKPEDDNKIPGKFNFTLNGAAQSAELKGFPTGLGYIATVGREAAAAEKSESHLRLDDRTVSRKQAEFIYEKGNLYLRNLSSTNPSQLNGKAMGSGSLDLVQPGSQMKFGEVIVTYQV